MWLLFLPAQHPSLTLNFLVQVVSSSSVGDEPVILAWPSPWPEGLVDVIM